MITTAAWSRWRAYPGRVAITPPPREGAPRGYRRHAGLFVRRPMTPAELKNHLAKLDPHRTTAELFATSYPWRPCLMGTAPAGVPSHRTIVARWLHFHTGIPFDEIDIERSAPTKVHPAHVPGLTAALSGSICT